MNTQRAIEIARLVFGPDSLELLKRELPCAEGSRGHAIVYAENAAGETIGKRDASPVVDWTLIERIKRWNDRVFGRTVQMESPKRRNMTAAQLACLRGDV